MRWIFLVVLSFSLVFLPWVSAQQSQPPAQQQTAQKDNQENPKQKESESFWQRTMDDPIALYTALLTAFTGVLALVSIVQGIFLYRAENITKLSADAAKNAADAAMLNAEVAQKQFLIAGRQTDIIEKQHQVGRLEFFATHRPIIRVRNVVIRNPISTHTDTPKTFFVKGQLVSGQFYIANIGGSQAIITGIGCWVIARETKHPERGDFLPMERPYEGQAPNIFSGGDEMKLMVSGSLPIAFSSDLPLNDVAVEQFNLERTLFSQDWWHLYIMGYIEYFDSVGTYMRTEFCRKFDPSSKRFVKVDNEDYEHED